MQLAGVLWLSIAGEYRYLMPFFTATLLLWPLYLLSRKVPATPEKALGRR